MFNDRWLDCIHCRNCNCAFCHSCEIDKYKEKLNPKWKDSLYKTASQQSMNSSKSSKHSAYK